jgi:hypothetical protein
MLSFVVVSPKGSLSVVFSCDIMAKRHLDSSLAGDRGHQQKVVQGSGGSTRLSVMGPLMIVAAWEWQSLSGAGLQILKKKIFLCYIFGLFVSIGFVFGLFFHGSFVLFSHIHKTLSIILTVHFLSAPFRRVAKGSLASWVLPWHSFYTHAMVARRTWDSPYRWHHDSI